MTILKLLIAFFIFIVPSADAAPKKLTPPAWLKNANGDFLHAMEIGKPYPLKKISKRPPGWTDQELEELGHTPSTWSYKGMAGPFFIIEISFEHPRGEDILILKKEKNHLILTDNVGKEPLNAPRVTLDRIDGQTLYYDDERPLGYTAIPYKSPLTVYPHPSLTRNNFYYQTNKISLDKYGKLGPVEALTLQHNLDPAPFDLSKIALNNDERFLDAAIADFATKKPEPYNQADLKDLAKHIDALYPAWEEKKFPTWLKEANAYFLNDMELDKKYPLDQINQEPQRKKLKNEVTKHNLIDSVDSFFIVYIENSYSDDWSYYIDNDILILKKEEDALVCTDRLARLRWEEPLYPKIFDHDIIFRIYRHADAEIIGYTSPLKLPVRGRREGGGMHVLYKVTFDDKGKFIGKRFEEHEKIGVHFLGGEELNQPFNLKNIGGDEDFLWAAINDFTLKQKSRELSEYRLKDLAKHIDGLYPAYKKNKKESFPQNDHS